ncbi:MAG: hypothetical protein KDB23_13085 [Planctomycetales bacterium]|nr:hypothetical protein [Planctomycetales bacterium]
MLPVKSKQNILNHMPIIRSIRDWARPQRQELVASDFVTEVRCEEERLDRVPTEQLRLYADEMRLRINRESLDSPALQIRVFALACSAIHRTLGVRLYDVQLVAASGLAEGAIVEMRTGEGKTFACAPAALLHAFTSRGVHIATPNAYLARRDYELLAPVFRSLGVTVGLLPDKEWTVADKLAAYRCDITYGTGYEFGFDYLRDQLSLRTAACRPLGAAAIEHLNDVATTHPQAIQRQLYFSIVDEADNVLIDDATSPLILSSAGREEASDATIHRAARLAIAQLRPGEHYCVTSSGQSNQLTIAGIERIHRAAEQIPIESLQRTWVEYVENALRAEALQRDVHYVVTESGRVEIVDANTGRILSDRTWSEGLHQAVETKEGVTITAERSVLASITRQRFLRLYERVSGMTGTAMGCKREFRHVYGLQVLPVPPRTPSRREIWPTRFFASRRHKWAAVAQSIMELHMLQRPVLVGTASIADSERVAVLLERLGVDFQLLNGRQDADEAAIISQAGQRGAITIATNLAGRGTDIKLDHGSFEAGGLHVIAGECSHSSRVDQQLFGRCGRQGDPGTAQMFVSAEDALLQHVGGWLASAIKRSADDNGEAKVDFSRPLSRIQRSAERVGYAARCNLLRRDLARDTLFTQQPIDP